ncbi:DegT/DnrJ/EryC1/StrS family aminotransferase [Paracoccaceae bacterium]
MVENRPITVGDPMRPDLQRLSGLMAEIVTSGWFSNGGPLQFRFEKALAAITEAEHLALVSSGTMALMMALRLGDLPEGAEVITPALGFAATAQAISWCGFRPVFADVAPDTLTLCPKAVGAAITPRTAAILPVHFLDIPCDVTALASLARKHRLWLVYDAAQAFGLRLNGRSIGEHGDATAFSLHATKVLHTGEGGYVVTDRAQDAARLRRMRNFGLEAGRMTGPGTNAKLSEAQAAIGLALLPDLSDEIAARQAVRERYDSLLAGSPGLVLHRGGPGASPGLTTYALRCAPALRARIHHALAERRILARDLYAPLCGPGTCWPNEAIITAAAEPVVPRAAQELLCLPLHGRVSLAKASRIAGIVRAVAAEASGAG